MNDGEVMYMATTAEQLKLHIKSITLTIFVSLILVGSYFFLNQPDKETWVPNVGSQVENFSFQNIDGVTHALNQLDSPIVIINLWASWCSPCIEEIPSLISLVKKFPGKIHLIAISADNTLTDIESFIKSFPELKSESITIVWDQDKSMAKKFNISGLPESYILDKNRTIIKKIIGTINWYTSDSIKYIQDKL